MIRIRRRLRRKSPVLRLPHRLPQRLQQLRSPKNNDGFTIKIPSMDKQREFLLFGLMPAYIEMTNDSYTVSGLRKLPYCTKISLGITLYEGGML